MILVAWDIETCPIALDHMTAVQLDRHKKEMERRLRSDPESSKDEASDLVRSTHPMLGWICCISAVSGTLEGGPNRPKSWVAERPDGEKELLSQFWAEVAGFPPSKTVWITFCGKRFDVPFLAARTARYGLVPSRYDLLCTYPYRNRPHTDLASLWPVGYSLEGLCDLLSVPSPKQDMNGGMVARAVESGEIEKVARYSQNDVIATFECLRTVPYLLNM